jgi:hypothetical protein|tara:strand:+ start:102 stop:500 length:399 start_codon:yes stop_codon:yes gene_type:complete
MIPCTLKPIQLSHKAPTRTKKYGVYSNSWHWSIKGYAKKKWAVIVKIDLNYLEAQKECDSDEEIVTKCIEYLNTPPKSKYGKKRKRKPLFGEFEPKPYLYKICTDGDDKYIEAYLVVKQNKHKLFWGKGATI